MQSKRLTYAVVAVLFFAVVFILAADFVFAAQPVSPDFLNVTANETKTNNNSASTVNISGSYIATLNVTTRTQDLRWKAFVGRFSGKFSLDDALGSTIFDWSVATVSGEVYATRNGTSIPWDTLSCASTSALESENTLMGLTNTYDNITYTFRNGSNPEFFVGNKNISLNSCPHNLNTYVGNTSQTTYFKETVLNSSNTLVYAAMLEQNRPGFDSNPYEFQMIVPERGTTGWSSSTAYYLYVEIS